jgi:tRNA(Ile)-lysidine synthase
VLARTPEGPVGIAISGGSDSTALLLLAARWARGIGRQVDAVTVDHGLRPESAAEAGAVAAFCAERGIGHAILRWQGWSGRGNLQSGARAARRHLIGGWARERGIACVALGHTLDDQAETVLLHLSRGSGVDGLAGMAPLTEDDGVLWVRPLLGIRRAALREWLVGEGLGWIDDPSNQDPAFDRVRARRAMADLATLGLSAERLAATAARMADARAALDASTAALAERSVDLGQAGDLGIDPARIAAAPREIGLRLLADCVDWVSGAAYRPRLVRLQAALDAVIGGRIGAGLTLHGCLLRRAGARIAIRREPGRCGPPVPAEPGAVWDARWRLEAAPPAPAAEVAAAGPAALAAAPDWRAKGIPRETLLATPAVWRAGRAGAEGGLLAAPFLGLGEGWRLVRTGRRRPVWVRRVSR